MEGGAIHCFLSNLSLKGDDGRRRSAVAKAAYNAGVNLWFEHEQRITTLRPRTDVKHTEIVTPKHAPAWCQDRTQLWNTVERTAPRVDSRLAKNIQAAITRGIPKEQWPAMVREYVTPFLAQGHVVDFVIHDDDISDNPHTHIMLTVRELKPNGFGKKFEHVDTKQFLTSARKRWADITNQYLVANGLPIRVDHRSYKDQGIPREPTKHRGPNRRERAAKRQKQQTIAPATHERTNVRPPSEKEQSMSEREPKQAKLLQPAPEQVPYTAEIPLDAPAPAPEQQDWFHNAYERRMAEQTGDVIITDEDLRDRTGLTVETDAERRLLLSVQDAPPEVRLLVEEEVHYQQQQRTGLTEQEARLTKLERNLTVEQQTMLDDMLEDQRQQQSDRPYPEPGPEHDLYRPQDLHRARQRMAEEYEREDQPQR